MARRSLFVGPVSNRAGPRPPLQAAALRTSATSIMLPTSPLSPQPFARTFRATSPITAHLRSPSPTGQGPLPAFTASLRETIPYEKLMHARPSRGLPVMRHNLPHDSDRVATRPRSSAYSFGSGREFGHPRPENSGTPRTFSRSGSFALNSGKSFGSTTSFGSSASRGGGSRTARQPPVTLPTRPAGYSNFSNPIGSSIWTGNGSPGNRSFYPISFGRHTFAPRTPSPTIGASSQSLS